MTQSGQDDAKSKEIKPNPSNQFSLTVSVISNHLELHLHDTISKSMYHNSFNAKELQSCGFSATQANNLQNVCKFMESARKGHHQLQFKISIQKNENSEITDADIAIITILKQDDFFPLEIKMKLKQTPRKKTDILEEHIIDLQSKNKKLTERVEQKISEIAELKRHIMPKGTIVMWSGNRDNIPKGWLLCDGKNGTPDLRNRFIIGVGDRYKVNAKGGTESHKHNITVNGHQLTINQIPSHTHSAHSGWQLWAKVSGSHMPGHFSGTDTIGGKSFLGAGLTNTGGNQAHSHGASASNSGHLPPYYALCFIVKVI